MTPEIKNRIEKIGRGEVPKGYKKTKAGILPTDWNVYILGDCLRRIERPVEVKPNNVLTISAQYGLINQAEFFNKAIASDDKSNYFLLERGDFAYNKQGEKFCKMVGMKKISQTENETDVYGLVLIPPEFRLHNQKGRELFRLCELKFEEYRDYFEAT